jgi:malate permease and related proteins
MPIRALYVAGLPLPNDAPGAGGPGPARSLRPGVLLPEPERIPLGIHAVSKVSHTGHRHLRAHNLPAQFFDLLHCGIDGRDAEIILHPLRRVHPFAKAAPDAGRAISVLRCEKIVLEFRHQRKIPPEKIRIEFFRTLRIIGRDIEMDNGCHGFFHQRIIGPADDELFYPGNLTPPPDAKRNVFHILVPTKEEAKNRIMSSAILPTLQAIIIMLGLIAIAYLLKMGGIIRDEHRPLFSRLVMDFALPAMIFSALATVAPVKWDIVAAGLMLAVVAGQLAIGWLIGTALHLTRPKMGAFMLAVAFSSSATLGYTLVSQIFPGNAAALTSAVMISELGVGIPCIVIGAVIAMYFGGSKDISIWPGLRAYLVSPLFIAIVAGLGASFLLSSCTNPLWQTFLAVLSPVGGSLMIFVALGVALMIRWVPLEKIGLLVVITLILSLVLQPLFAIILAAVVTLPVLQTQVLVLETAMPSGMIAAVLSARYGCDGELASVLVMATYVFSLITLPVVMLLLHTT